MRIFPPPLEITDTEGFSSEGDLFGRKRLGTGLSNFVGRVTDPTVIAIDGQWGSGKTVFLKMWAGELRKLGFPVVYFDAFAHDYTGDAFAAIAGEIIGLVEEKKTSQSSAVEGFVEKAVGAGKVLLRSGLKIGVKAATLGALDTADLKIDIKEVSGDLSSEAANLADKYVGELLTKQREQKQAIEAFRDALASLPELLIEQSSEEGDGRGGRPLVFIVDELDRCRPLFALEILERIKHFFSVPNVHFVLGVHLDQLCNSVAVAYGPQIDAQMYLQKFIYLRFDLLDPPRFGRQETLSKFVEHLSRTMEFSPADHDTVGYTAEIILHVADHHGMTLRTLERIMGVLAISLAFRPKNMFCPPSLLGGLCVIKVTHPTLFRKAKLGTLVYEDVGQALGLNSSVGKQSELEYKRSWWRFYTNRNASPELLDKLKGDLGVSLNDRERVVPRLANEIIDRLQSDLAA